MLDFTLTQMLSTGFASFALAVYFTGKDGPWNIFARLRSWVGTPLQCFVCAGGVWFLMLLFIGDTVFLFHTPHPFPTIWVTLKFYLSASGVCLFLLAIAGKLNLDV